MPHRGRGQLGVRLRRFRRRLHEGVTHIHAHTRILRLLIVVEFDTGTVDTVYLVLMNMYSHRHYLVLVFVRRIHNYLHFVRYITFYVRFRAARGSSVRSRLKARVGVLAGGRAWAISPPVLLLAYLAMLPSESVGYVLSFCLLVRCGRVV